MTWVCQRSDTTEYVLRNISIHSPLAGRDMVCVFSFLEVTISIHSPLAGRDLVGKSLHGGCQQLFQSTRPSRGETLALSAAVTSLGIISIHSPLAGRDPGSAAECGGPDISIHSPLAGRDNPNMTLMPPPSAFQSTRPSRGETRPHPPCSG